MIEPSGWRSFGSRMPAARRRRRRATRLVLQLRSRTRRTTRRSRSAAVSSGEGTLARRVAAARPASARARARARARGRAASRRATRRSRRAAARPRTPRRRRRSRASRSISSVDIRALRHHSAPVTNGPWAAGSPWSTRTVPRWFASSEQMPAAVEPQLERRELGERLEIGAHLALLEVLGEAKRVLGRCAAVGKVRSYSARSRPGGGVAAQVLDRPLERARRARAPAP